MSKYEISFYRQPRLDRHFIVRHGNEQIAVPADFFFGIFPDVDMFATTGFMTVTDAQFNEIGFEMPSDRVKYFRAVDRSIYFVHLPGTAQNLVIPRAVLAKIAGISGYADVGVTMPLSPGQLTDIGFVLPRTKMEVAAHDCAIPA